MFFYVTKRLILSIFITLIASVAIFIVIDLAPGTAADVMLGGPEYGPEEVEALKESLGLNDPLHIRYLRWVSGVVTRFDFGQSYLLSEDVNARILSALPITFEILIFSTFLETIFGFLLGSMAAFNKDGMIDHICRIISVIFVSTPGFWLGMIFIVYIALNTNLLPVGRYIPITQDIIGNLSSILLPSLVLALRQGGVIGRLTRSELLDVGSGDFVRTLRAVGAPKWSIRKKIFRNGLIPSVTMIALTLGFLISNAMIIELIFDLPGLGFLLYTSIIRLDVPVIQGLLFIVTIFFVWGNFVVDLLYSFLDPKIRYGEK